MSANIFERVKEALHPRLDSVIPELLPGGKINGREYICGSLQGRPGNSCKTNLDTGRGSDFSTNESWGDVIGLWAKVRSISQGAAARELADRYGIHLDGAPQASQAVPPPAVSTAFTLIVPVPDTAQEPPPHPRHGQAHALWRYADLEGRTLAYVARFDLPDGSKEILPLCYGSNGNGPRWHWKALPEPRPLYGLEKLAALPEAPVLLVEGEKTADAAQAYFPDQAVLTWSGGANAVAKADVSPLHGRKIILWPDNDEPGFKAALTLAELLEGKADVSIVQPPDTLPEKWDLADVTEPGFLPQVHITTALSVEEFRQKAGKRFPGLAPSIQEGEDPEDMSLKEWPQFSFDACPGIVGEFVSLAIRDSEADPAAVCVTMLARFAVEVYGYAEGKGPYTSVTNGGSAFFQVLRPELPDGNLLNIMPVQGYGTSTIVVTLQQRDIPLVIRLESDSVRSPERTADALVLFKLAHPGPKAAIPIIEDIKETASSELLAFLDRVAYLVGVVFTVVAAVQAVSQKHRFNRSTAVWSFWAAVLLLNLPTLMDSLSMTVFNQSSEQSLSYSPPSHPGSVYIQFAVYGIMTVGAIGIARGICLMRDTPNQAMNMSRGIVHLFGGILAVNIIPFLRGIGATVGGDVQSYIAKIIG